MSSSTSHRYWFKAKRYGWAWYPSSWEGWTVLGVYIWFFVWDFVRIDTASHSVSDTLINFIPEAVILTAILVFICIRTGKKP